MQDDGEDLAVMSRILTRAVRTWNTGRSLYIEGYGALFAMTSRVPLSDSAARATDDEVSEWERTKRQLEYGWQFDRAPGVVMGWVSQDAAGVDEAVRAALEALADAQLRRFLAARDGL